MAAAATAGALVVGCSHGGDAPPRAAALTAYLDSVGHLAQRGGRVIELGVKPLMTDLEKAPAAEPTMHDQAVSLLRQIGDVRDRWTRERPPPALQETHAAFLSALDLYVETADAVVQAAKVARDERKLLTRARSLGERADDVWDTARERARRVLRQARVGVPSWIGS